jgi:CubicO group peptidase (beta-lactamase class C family)
LNILTKRLNKYPERFLVKRTLLSLKLVVVLFICTAGSGSQSLYFPPLAGSTWETVTPASLGWCTDSIDTLISFLAANRTKAFIVLKDGRIVLEQYFGSFTGDSVWYWASAGKSLTAFLLGIAQHDGILSIDDSTSHYLGAGWTSCPKEKEGLITVLHQLTMTSGLQDLVSDSHCTLPECLFYQADAGTRWAYHNAPYTLLDSVLQVATGQTINQYFSATIRPKTGMGGLWIRIGYDNVYFSNARSMARFGLLALNHGIWNTDTLMADTSYFRRMTTTSQSLNPSYGYLWWLNGKNSYMVPTLQYVFTGSWAPDAPADMFAALGKNGQFINIVPSQNLIMVRMGEAPDTSYDVPMEFNNDIWRRLNAVICNQTSVVENIVPSRVVLEQNYPNPFNPSTTIKYYLPSRSFVSLKIFDLMGREITTLVSRVMPAGDHSQLWNPIGIPSGIYFYRLNVGNYSETQKLLLIK